MEGGGGGELLKGKEQNRTDLGKCTHLYDETQGNEETQAH